MEPGEGKGNQGQGQIALLTLTLVKKEVRNRTEIGPGTDLQA